MLTLQFCEKCRDKLESYGVLPVEVFAEICSYYHYENTPLEISTNIHQSTSGKYAIIGFLEAKGYVVTTESGIDVIRVKPLGFEYLTHAMGTAGYFCLCGGNRFD